jgi:indolepyruvate ferredoxin oxidoreductase, beta subunit
MTKPIRQQILVGGVGGQGVLFVSRLLAEAAILRGLPVLTTETHGMAQRGGTVVSHLKVGRFTSPMIRPGQADCLLALMPENVAQQGLLLKADAWVAVNGSGSAGDVTARPVFAVDASGLAAEIGNPDSMNLVLLGFALGRGPGMFKGHRPLFCSLEDLRSVLKERLAGRERVLEMSLLALEAGYGAV